MNSANPKYLSIQGVSQLYGIPVSTLYKLSARRVIPLAKIGSKVLIPVLDFERWLSSHRVDKVRR